MLDTKLFYLLQQFDAYKANRFGKFLLSPYFNEDEKLVNCYLTLAPYLKKQLPLPDKQQVWKQVFGKAKFSSLRFARLYSDLAKKAEEFLLHDRIRSTNSDKAIDALSFYNTKKPIKYFAEAYKQAQALHQKQVYRDADFYLQQFKLDVANNAYLELQNQRTSEKNITQTLQSLDQYYFIEKLNYLAALLHYKKFLSAEGEVAMAAEVLAYLKQTEQNHIPAIAINYRIVLSLMEPRNEAHFKELKLLLHKHATLFQKESARNFYAYAINFCIRQINFGGLKYVHELLMLYKEMLQHELMTDELGIMSQFDYKNIITVALRAEDVTWAAKFIDSYKNKLPKPDRQNAYTFNLARLYFKQRQFDKVLQLLQDVKYSDIFYQLDSKTTLMKTYYELGEYLPLMALKESFRILLRRKKVISEQNRINYMNFTRFVMKLYRTDVKDVAKIQTLQKSIASSTNVADKGWLIEKMNELG